MNEHSNEDNYSKHSQKEIERIQRREKYIAETRAWLANHEGIKEYLKKYSERNAADFLEQYANQKALWLEYGSFYAEQNLKKDVRWMESAWEALCIIQQKKLFDAQCLWRAEKLDIPGLKVCFEFVQWERNILNCPFIEPVNERDIELFASFLNSMNPETEMGWLDGWQDYDEIKAAYNEQSETRNFPQWYDYVNIHQGTSAYLLLPNIRGKKEQVYISAAMAEARTNFLKANPNYVAPPPYNPDNFLSYFNKSQRNDFIERFETKEHKYLYKEYERAHEGSGEIEDIDIYDFALTLENLGETFPIEAHYNYKVALMNGYRKHCRTRQAEHLQFALEEYRMNESLGIAQSGTPNYLDQIKETYINNVLKGRKLLGEPENFDYLDS